MVPSCIAGLSVTYPASSKAWPFSDADSTKLFTRTCEEAWNSGLFFGGTKSSPAKFQALAVNTMHEMIQSGEITIRT